MHITFRRFGAQLLLLGLAVHAVAAQTLRPTEKKVRDWIAAHREEQIGFLEQMVNIPSGSLNIAGVQAVGALYRAQLDSLGFRTQWIEMPAEMHRGGHLVAERIGKKAGKTPRRLLLLGHFDTVFEGEGQRFVRMDSIARGAGTSDMKGGDAVLLYALKALAANGLLETMHITVVVTGDEELTGRPLDVARAALIEAAKRSDVALSFEGGSRTLASISRRGSSNWRLTVKGRQAHSAGVFGSNYGAIYETARILDSFREQLVGAPGLTFNPGFIVGGTEVIPDSSGYNFTVSGKTNIISPLTMVRGDLRFVTEEQKETARAVMREIVAKNLPGTSAEIMFEDSYPAMPITPAGEALLAQYDSASRALGYPGLRAMDAANRGAGDLSFVAPYIPGLDGMGALGAGAHSPQELVNLPTLEMQTARAAVLMVRLAGIRK